MRLCSNGELHGMEEHFENGCVQFWMLESSWIILSIGARLNLPGV